MLQKKSLLAAIVVSCCISSSSGAAAMDRPMTDKASWNAPGSEDHKQISDVLENYTRSVSQGNRALFESQLLDLHIPFKGVGKSLDGAAGLDLHGVQDYAGFRKSIFDSGKQFKQRFSNVKMEQVGNLAQVSLDYETALQGTDYDGKGWKVIQLLKVGGRWKIASEFYTGYPDAAAKQK